MYPLTERDWRGTNPHSEVSGSGERHLGCGWSDDRIVAQRHAPVDAGREARTHSGRTQRTIAPAPVVFMGVMAMAARAGWVAFCRGLGHHRPLISRNAGVRFPEAILRRGNRFGQAPRLRGTTALTLHKTHRVSTLSAFSCSGRNRAGKFRNTRTTVAYPNGCAGRTAANAVGGAMTSRTPEP